jgi:hypothetical protein
VTRDFSIRDRPFPPPRDGQRSDGRPVAITRSAVARFELCADYDPAALGERLDGYLDQSQRYYLARDQNVFTSLYNAFVSTTARLPEAERGILRVGTGTAQPWRSSARSASASSGYYTSAISESDRACHAPLRPVPAMQGHARNIES